MRVHKFCTFEAAELVQKIFLVKDHAGGMPPLVALKEVGAAKLLR